MGRGGEVVLTKEVASTVVNDFYPTSWNCYNWLKEFPTLAEHTRGEPPEMQGVARLRLGSFERQLPPRRYTDDNPPRGGAVLENNPTAQW